MGLTKWKRGSISLLMLEKHEGSFWNPSMGRNCAHLCRAMRQAHIGNYSTRLGLRYRDLLLSLCHWQPVPPQKSLQPNMPRNSSQCTVCKDLLAVGQTTTLQHWILSQELQETGTASFKLRTKYLHFIPYCWHYQPLLTCHFMCFHGEEESKPT